MRYVDGYVMPVPKNGMKAYIWMARLTETGGMKKEMPFDVKRMVCGGFKAVVET